MAIEGFTMRRGWKEREGVNETPHSVVVFCVSPLGLALYL